MVFASMPSPSDIAINSVTFSASSLRNPFTLALLLASSPKIFLSFNPGINFAILSASCNGKSKTLAVSLIDDFAAIVP